MALLVSHSMHKVDLIVFELNDSDQALDYNYHCGELVKQWERWSYEYGPGCVEIIDREYLERNRWWIRCRVSCACCILLGRRVCLRRIRIVRVQESPFEYHMDMQTTGPAMFGDGHNDALAAIVSIRALINLANLLNFVLRRMDTIAKLVLAPGIPIAVMVERGCLPAQPELVEAQIRDQLQAKVKCFEVFPYWKNPQSRINEVYRYLYRNCS